MLRHFPKSTSKYLSYHLFKQCQRPFYSYILPDPRRTTIPEEPEKSLFSSFIKSEYSPEQSQELETEYNLKFDNQESEKQLRPFKKISNFELTKSDYSAINDKNPLGRVNIFTYKDTKFTLVGPQYEFIPNKNIYKILALSKPSTIILQARPDQILKSINLCPKNNTDKFSNRKYFAQLEHSASSMMPSTALKQKVYGELLKNGLLVDEGESNSNVAYKPYNHLERLSPDAIATACLYAESRGIKIILGDMPETVYRQNIANSLTLLQLQNIFTHCSRELALYPDLKPQTPFTMACLLYPEIFVKPTDKYMTTLFEYMIHKGHKNILGLVGYNQSETMKEMLDKRKVSNLETELKIEPIPKSILRDFQGEEVLEKHSLLDVMINGAEILDNMDKINFKTTYEMIKKYADPLHVDSAKTDNFRLMHYQFIVKYHAYCIKEFENGRLLLKREFLRKLNI